MVDFEHLDCEAKFWSGDGHSFSSAPVCWITDNKQLFFISAICKDGCNSQHGSCDIPGECK